MGCLPGPAGAGNRIQRTDRETSESPAMPIARADALERSMMRPRTKGPRSLILTTTVRPVARFLTFTRVPNGKVL